MSAAAPRAKGAIRKEESVIVVEGYFDVLRLALAGVEHVVAPLGTALTSEQAVTLRRFARAAPNAGSRQSRSSSQK